MDMFPVENRLSHPLGRSLHILHSIRIGKLGEFRAKEGIRFMQAPRLKQPLPCSQRITRSEWLIPPNQTPSFDCFLFRQRDHLRHLSTNINAFSGAEGLACHPLLPKRGNIDDFNSTA